MTESKTYNGLLGLDRLPTWIKTVIWIAAFLWTTGTCATAIDQSLQAFGKFRGFGDYYGSIPYEIYAIYIIAPTAKTLCFTGAGLRLAGIRWLYVLIFLVTTSWLTYILSTLIVAAASVYNHSG